MRILAGGNVAMDMLVELTAHAAKTFAGIAQISFRRLEGFAGTQLPAEVERLDTDLRASDEVLIHMDAGFKAAGIAQCEAIDVAVFFGGVRRSKSFPDRPERADGYTSGAHGPRRR